MRQGNRKTESLTLGTTSGRGNYFPAINIAIPFRWIDLPQYYVPKFMLVLTAELQTPARLVVPGGDILMNYVV